MAQLTRGETHYKMMTLMAPNIRKFIYRSFRYHWLTEWLQNVVRRSSILVLPEVGLDLEIQQGDIIIDCGANVGDLTSRFARSGAKVYAFEPNPSAFRILSRRFRALPAVQCFNQGVMDRECVLSLNIPIRHGPWDAIDATVSGSLDPHAYESSGIKMEHVNVECIDLGKFIRSLASNVRLLKIDIEGAELPVLNSLIDTGIIHHIDHLVVETHEEQMPHLLAETETLRMRISKENLEEKVNLGWV